MEYMPTSDQIVTTNHHPFKGFLTGDNFVFHTREGETHRFSYAQIRSIWLCHTWLFSEYDPTTIFSLMVLFRNLPVLVELFR
jgi:hypothetical protein